MSDSTPPLSHDIPRLRAREGFAMALALGALVIIGMLITGVFFISSQQARSGRAVLNQERAFRAAEAGLAETISDWENDSSVALANGQSWVRTSVPVTGVPAALRPTVTVTKLNGDLFHLVSSSSYAKGAGERIETTRRVSQLLRVVGPTFNIRGALTVKGQTKIGGSSLIDGNDSNPTGWACDAAGAALPGIAASDTTQITTSGCSNYSCVSGSPKVLQDPVAGQTSTYFNYGDFNWATLVSMADLVVTTNVSPAPALTLDGKCDKTLVSNWGDVNRLIPQGACETWFPIVYYPGNAKLTGGTGQGILLVEGDLEVDGLFKFFGPVIVRGRLKTAGTGGHFNGAVMAANVDLEENTVLGNAVVNYSSCAVESAIRQAGRPRLVIQRGWAEMY